MNWCISLLRKMWATHCRMLYRAAYLRAGGEDVWKRPGAPLVMVMLACMGAAALTPLEVVANEPNPGNQTSSADVLAMTTVTLDAEALATLLQDGADPNAADKDGFSLLHTVLMLARRGPLDTLHDYVRTLLQYGANPNLPDAHGWTPMHLAAQIDNKTVMSILLDAGGDPRLNTGITSPYELALMAGHWATVMAIESRTDYRPENLQELQRLGLFARKLDGLQSAQTAEERASVVQAAVHAYTDNPEEAERLYRRTLHLLENRQSGKNTEGKKAMPEVAVFQSESEEGAGAACDNQCDPFMCCVIDAQNGYRRAMRNCDSIATRSCPPNYPERQSCMTSRLAEYEICSQIARSTQDRKISACCSTYDASAELSCIWYGIHC